MTKAAKEVGEAIGITLRMYLYLHDKKNKKRVKRLMKELGVSYEVC